MIKFQKSYFAKQSKFSRITFFVIAILLIGVGSTYIGLRIWFKAEINHVCDYAMTQFEGDKLEAMIAFLESDTPTLSEKNDAIWALGKLNDERALPVLRNLKTGEVCDHTKYVCQRELEKAINNLEGKSIDLLTFR